MPYAGPIVRAEYNRQYREKNRIALCGKEKQRWHSVYKFQTERNREFRRKRRYGLTNQEFDALLAAQGGSCALCHEQLKLDKPKTFHIAHCHKTKKVRGILCARCNLGLGRFGDSIEQLEDAIAYLKK